jgi:putative transposase
MIVLEAKLKGKDRQFEALDEAIRTAVFVRNSCLRYWIDNKGTSRNDLYKYCKVLADSPEFPWASKLNSQARQAHAERAWSAIARFFDNCKKQVQERKAIPNSRSTALMPRWNISAQGGNYQKIDVLSPSQMALRLVISK